MTPMKIIKFKNHLPKTRQASNKEFEKVDFYEVLFTRLTSYQEIGKQNLEKGDICLNFDVWREPYRVGDSMVSEMFMEIILGRVEHSEPLTLSEAICLNTYQDSIRYTKNSLTWSRGSRLSSQPIKIDYNLFQELGETLDTQKWVKDISYKKEHIVTLVKRLTDYFTMKLPSEKKEKDFEKVRFYEPLTTILMNQDRLGSRDPEIGEIYVYFDVWREPYRVGDSMVSEIFMEILIGRIININPLSFSEAISLDTYQDKLIYSPERLTWSRGSIVSPRELIPVNHDLFHRIKLMLKTSKWEDRVSYNKKYLNAFVRNLENYFTGKYSGKNYRVAKREVLVEESKREKAVISMELEAPEIAAEAAPGQFVVIRLHERGERIPLTIAETNKDEGKIRIIFQVVGKTTEELAAVKKGEFILDLLGPLGIPIKIEKYDKPVICIAGGVGVASIYAKTKALKKKGNYIISIIGAKNKDVLVLEEEMKQISDELYVTTDDGSCHFSKDGTECLYRTRKDGSKIYGGFVTSVLEALFGHYRLLAKENDMIKDAHKKFIDYGPSQMVSKYSPNNVAMVIAVGPIPMMHAVVNVVAGNGKYDPKRDYRDGLLPTFVSLNPIMVDGIGICGSCRVRIINPEEGKFETKFACVDGPTFNGLLVDFESLLNRTIQYKPKEQISENYLTVTGW